MSQSTIYDLLVIGGGPGGYVAALRAAQLGLKTALVERDRVGGVCLNWGCIPTKAFLRSSEIYRYLLHSAEYGLSLENPGFDLKAIVARSRRVAERLSHGVDYLLKKRKVPVIQGEARLEKGREAPHVIVKMSSGEEQRYQARHVILATGAHARTLPKAGLEPDGKFIWTYKQALQPDIMPKSLLVIGSGAIGVEFASFFSTLGAKTMMVEMADRILPAEDHEIAAFAHKQFQAQGMEIRTKAQTTHLEKREESVLAHIKNDTGETEVFEAGRVILAIGIEANTEGLGLEALGVQMERGHVLTDEFSATDCPGLYAIGDITAPPWLAHKASHEAVVCVEASFGITRSKTNKNIIKFSKPFANTVTLQTSYFIRVRKTWNILSCDLRHRDIGLHTFKSKLETYYEHALIVSSVYNCDDPRTGKFICVKCRRARSLDGVLRCC